MPARGGSAFGGKKSHYITTAILGLMITTAVVGVTSFAATPDATTKADWTAKHQEMKQIMVDGKYDAWNTTMQEKIYTMHTRADELESKINQDTFNKLTEAHQLMENGDKEGAQEIREELGLGGPGQKGKAFHKGFGDGKNCQAHLK